MLNIKPAITRLREKLELYQVFRYSRVVVEEDRKIVPPSSTSSTLVQATSQCCYNWKLTLLRFVCA